MKKSYTVFLVVAVFLLFPICAAATLIDTGSLDMDYSWPYQQMIFPSQSGTYYADYDATYSLLDKTYENQEIFCVEDVPGSGSSQTYDFYTIDSSLDNYEKYVGATWVANWLFKNQSDTNKAIAQVAIWEIVLESEVIDYNLSNGNLQAEDYYLVGAQNLLSLFTVALNNGEWDDYADDWLLAVNDNYQNYLVPNHPIPEPATMLLLGTGLIGLAAIGRRRFT